MISRLEYVKKHVVDVLESLSPNQVFSVISFNTEVNSLFPGFLQATAANIDLAVSKVHQWHAEGETNLLAAMQQAYALPNINAVYLLSDGEPTCGETDTDIILARVAEW